ncbi:MAG: 5'-methylthioadenosine/S-adenosylhomocysteine nucleosidase, partial [Propionibacteriaceae bacterium]|nr:5'-methylthioadenosine/S-adenosylhomocysteine nucleosidase [Propionibacteriaceae bacterium]
FNPRWEQPELGISRFPSAPSAVRALRTAADTVLARGNPVAALDLPAPHVREGLIVSGDVFVRSHEAVRQLRQDLPEALAVDMESAAAAQVCTSARLPLGIVRVISDRANSQAPVDFPAFLKLAAPLLRDLVVETLAHLD